MAKTIGDPTRGCRHCGSVTTHQVDGTTIYRPSTECWLGAVLDRLQRRSDEPKTLRKQKDTQDTLGVRTRLSEALEDQDRLRAKLRRMEM